MTRPMKPEPTPPTKLRDQLLDDLKTLGAPLPAETLDGHLSRAAKQRLSPLELFAAVVGEQANLRRQRAVERRIREAKFRQEQSLEGFDWDFNAKAIDRAQIEELAGGDFIRRKDNLVIIGQSGVGKSRIIQAVGRQACVQGCRVRYFTSGDLLRQLTAALADKTLPRKIAALARLDLLIIDEFGFERLERAESQQAASLFYKAIDARSQKQSTALISNIDFDAWANYLGDPPLAMAFLDRLVDHAIILKINGKSYRAHRSETRSDTRPTKSPR